MPPFSSSTNFSNRLQAFINDSCSSFVRLGNNLSIISSICNPIVLFKSCFVIFWSILFCCVALFHAIATESLESHNVPSKSKIILSILDAPSFFFKSFHFLNKKLKSQIVHYDFSHYLDRKSTRL